MSVARKGHAVFKRGTEQAASNAHELKRFFAPPGRFEVRVTNTSCQLGIRVTLAVVSLPVPAPPSFAHLLPPRAPLPSSSMTLIGNLYLGKYPSRRSCPLSFAPQRRASSSAALLLAGPYLPLSLGKACGSIHSKVRPPKVIRLRFQLTHHVVGRYKQW